MRTILVVSAVLGLSLIAQAIPPFPPPQVTATAVNVVDGDTIDVRITAIAAPAPADLNVEKGVRVRYIGVDAPEFDHPVGQAATDLNAALVQGKTVYLELDERHRDNGRLLAYVYLDPSGLLMVNLILVATDIIATRTDPGTERYTALFAHSDAVPSLKPPPRCDPVVPWSEARTRVGEPLCVEGLVASVGTSAGGDVFLNLGHAYPNPNRFTLFIPARYVGRFEAEFGSKFWTNLKGTVVRAYGEVKLYQGIPEIQLSDPAMLFLKQ
ncbi:MAG: thermonuclease family protein [Candidatus Bipolaricaulota bacterium]